MLRKFSKFCWTLEIVKPGIFSLSQEVRLIHLRALPISQPAPLKPGHILPQREGSQDKTPQESLAGGPQEIIEHVKRKEVTD